MILVDAVYITYGGGKVLLDLLIEKIEQTENKNKIHILIDIRNKDLFLNVKYNKITIIFLKNSELSRALFYIKNRNLLSKVFCFANIPPPIRLKCKVSTFFQNILLIDRELRSNFSFKLRLSLFLKEIILKSRNNFCDDWIVQTEHVKVLLANNLNIQKQSIKIFPCFEDININLKNKTSSAFFYPAINMSHKNLEKLIDVWNYLFKKNLLRNELHLTIENNDTNNISTKLFKYQLEGVPIVNHKYISKFEVNKLYAKCKFVIHPSLGESFGLVLIEAIQNNCVLLAPNLPYVNSIVKPNYYFDPHKTESLVQTILSAISGENKLPASIVIKNKSKDFINHILN
tara:strand:- start:4855 stop:5886 length:1032 start_codon:yes stop_codon:yes gene_type:complete